MANVKDEILFLDWKGLVEFTDGCREDMHEPDEQNIEARVVGDHLDNAMGTDIRSEAIEQGYQEFVVVLKRNNKTLKINLANLIALARKAENL